MLAEMGVEGTPRPKKGQATGLSFSGAEYEIRTRDPQLGKLMLYQLS